MPNKFFFHKDLSKIKFKIDQAPPETDDTLPNTKKASPNTAKTPPNLGADWNRIQQDIVNIDGTNLTDVIADLGISYNDFDMNDEKKTKKVLEELFSKKFLHKCSESGEAKLVLIEWMLSTFHQGGHLYTLSAALKTAIADIQLKSGDIRIIPREEIRQLDITTSESGLKFKQTYTVNMAGDVSEGSDEFLEPDKGKDYILKAELIYEIRFEDRNTMVIERMDIDWGSKTYKKLFNGENYFVSLFTKIIEAIKDFFNLKSVVHKQDLSKGLIEIIDKANTAPADTEKYEPLPNRFRF